MKILCCGDSHLNIFKYINNKQNKYKFDICIVPGATAQGAVNPNSKTNALNIFFNKIINTTKLEKILIMLGEVDCGFVIWVRSKKYKISIDQQINNSVSNLFSFINQVLNKTSYKPQDIIICGAILPTIKDSTNKKYLNGARSEVNVNQEERTKKTIEYNNILKSKCENLGYNYIEITKYIINSKGIVDNVFLNKSPYDHHLNNETTFSFWIEELNKIY